MAKCLFFLTSFFLASCSNHSLYVQRDIYLGVPSENEVQNVQVPVFGHQVRISYFRNQKKWKITGELVAVSKEHLWIKAQNDLKNHSLPKACIKSLLITHQVLDRLKDSKRTLFLKKPNDLKSAWPFLFQYARYPQGMPVPHLNLPPGPTGGVSVEDRTGQKVADPGLHCVPA